MSRAFLSCVSSEFESYRMLLTRDLRRAGDQLFIFMQAGLYLTLTRGHQAPEARICYESAQPLCRSLKRRVFAWNYGVAIRKTKTGCQVRSPAASSPSNAI